MKAELSAEEISEAIGITERSVRRRAATENWEFKKVKNGRTQKKYYSFRSLPTEIQLLINKVEIQNQSLPTAPAPNTPATDITCTEQPSLCRAQIDKAMAKTDLLRLYLGAVKKAGWGKKDAARTGFMAAYNCGIAYPKLYESLGALSWKTIEQWKRAVRTNGDTFNLADRRGYSRRQQHTVAGDQQKVLLRCALHPNRPKVSEVIRLARAVMETKGIQNGHSDATYRRWLGDWKSRNHHIWVFSRQGAKAWNDQCAMYIERDYSLIKVGDILVADGHVLNFEILNPWTGKPKRMTLILWYDMKSNFPLGWEIMPTENTAAIAAALRRAILRLGKYPQVVYLDNGKAFGARFFGGVDLAQEKVSGIYERMGVKVIHAWPYHGQSKTIERFFGSFAELERWCPTYTGISIEKKPPRMMRGERIHRRVYDKLMDGGCITLEQAHRAVAAWFDQYAGRGQSGHLCGLAPADVFMEGKGPGVDAAELQYLMMSREIRHIRRNGIHLLGHNYYHPELYGRRHPVTIRYDLQDKSAIWVFAQNGDIICEARRVEKVHPAATALGSEADRARLTEHIESKKRQEKAASSLARVFLEEEVIPEHRRQMAQLGMDGVRTLPASKAKQLPQETAAEEEARILAEVEELKALNDEMPAEAPEEEYIPEVVDDAAELRLRLERMDETDRYETLMEMDVMGQMIPRRWRAYMSYFELDPEYERNRDYFEERRAKLAVTYQTSMGQGL